MAYHLMPMLGSFDILMGILILFFPVRAVLGWLVFWGFFTALLRPISGESFAEFFERGGNYGAALALLIISGKASTLREWFSLIKPGNLVNSKTMARAIWCLRITTFLLFLGHGWLNIIAKKGLIGQYMSLGFSNPTSIALTIGILEIAAAFVILIRPVRPFLMAFIVWKMASELFYPHYEFFEWIERGGSYGTLIALWFALPLVSHSKPRFRLSKLVAREIR